VLTVCTIPGHTHISRLEWITCRPVNLETVPTCKQENRETNNFQSSRSFWTRCLCLIWPLIYNTHHATRKSIRVSKTWTTCCDKDNRPHFSSIHSNILDIYVQILQVHTFFWKLRAKLCTHFFFSSTSAI
jgi:hypothetical protein